MPNWVGQAIDVAPQECTNVRSALFAKGPVPPEGWATIIDLNKLTVALTIWWGAKETWYGHPYALVNYPLPNWIQKGD